MPEKDLNNYISLQEATEHCPYSQEYLSLRARQGKLRAVKIGRNWVTKKEWLEKYAAEVEGCDTSNTISLSEASKLCNYSQEYLSLRARQGKLKAVKVGRNWTTKREWLKEYIDNVEDYKGDSYRYIEKVETEEPAPVVEKVIKKKEKVRSYPPGNLPVGEFEFLLPSRLVKRPTLRMGFVLALVLLLVLASGVFGQPFFQSTFKIASKVGNTVIEETSRPIKQSFVIVSEKIKYGVSKLTNKVFEDEISLAAVENMTSTLKEYNQWLASKLQKTPFILVIGRTVKRARQDIERQYIVANDFTKKKFSLIANTVLGFWQNSINPVKTAYIKIFDRAYKISQAVIGILQRTGEFVFRPFREVFQFAKRLYQISLFEKPEKREGMVVIPSTKEDEAVKEKIKKSFSDEVKIKLTDKSSGIITPIFRDGEGEKYMYLLVPVNK